MQEKITFICTVFIILLFPELALANDSIWTPTFINSGGLEKLKSALTNINTWIVVVLGAYTAWAIYGPATLFMDGKGKEAMESLKDVMKGIGIAYLGGGFVFAIFG